jgi:hypothetical protein
MLSEPRDSSVADSELRSHPWLGRTTCDESGRPGNFIEISVTTLTSMVMGASHFGRPMSDLPPFYRMNLVGRGLGRALAHEIGHWIMGRGHTRDGLMRATFGIADLIQPKAPTLPSAAATEALARVGRHLTAP